MKRNILFTLALSSLVLFSSCSSSKQTKKEAEDPKEKTYIERYEDALIAFEKKKYLVAALLLIPGYPTETRELR